MPRRSQMGKKLKELKALLAGKGTLLIALQDSPDPDALAAGVALRRLARDAGVASCSLASGGAIGRAENRALVRYLDLNVRALGELGGTHFDLRAMVDTQPGAGNNSLPPGILPDIVIDHHPMRPETRRVSFRDIRSRYGATSTILLEYLQEARIALEAPLATALLYGIRSDTQDLGRESTQADLEAYRVLFPAANKRALGKIHRGQVPTEYFRMLASALASAWRGSRCIYAGLGDVENADMIAEVADLLLRHEDAEWSLCWGHHAGRCLLSLRTSVADGRADRVIRRIVSRKGSGGGHRMMAGGKIPVADSSSASRRTMNRLIVRRYLRAIGSDGPEPHKLL